MNKNNFKKIKELTRAFFRSLPMSLTTKKSKKYFGQVSADDWFVPFIPQKKVENILITWIGHSSFLIQINGLNILVDPIFEDLMFLYRRNFPPGISLHDLPKIDFILISHNHGDHFHKKTILKLKKHNPVILIPKGLRAWFDKNKFSNVYEKDYWQESVYKSFNKNIKISFLPAVHWSGQSLFDINKSICGSWMLSTEDKNIYFAGDTAYGNHFVQIAEKYKKIDVALMPVSPCSPREFVKDSHLDAHESIQAFIELKADNFIPMHWGTFRINLDRFSEPIELLKSGWVSFGSCLENKKLHVLKFGQSLEI